MVLYSSTEVKAICEDLCEGVYHKINVEKLSSEEVFVWLLAEQMFYHRYDVLGCGFTKEQWSEVSNVFTSLYKELNLKCYKRMKKIIDELFKWSELKEDSYTDVRDKYPKITERELLVLLLKN